MRPSVAIFAAFISVVGLTQGAAAQSASDLAKKLANPIANLISVPFQANYNSGFGDGDGQQTYINIQPVIPISIGPELEPDLAHHPARGEPERLHR